MRWAKYRWCSGYNAYWEGLDDRLDGLPLEENPYLYNSRNWVCWRAGWFADEESYEESYEES